MNSVDNIHSFKIQNSFILHSETLNCIHEYFYIIKWRIGIHAMSEIGDVFVTKISDHLMRSRTNDILRCVQQTGVKIAL